MAKNVVTYFFKSRSEADGVATCLRSSLKRLHADAEVAVRGYENSVVVRANSRPERVLRLTKKSMTRCSH